MIGRCSSAETSPQHQTDVLSERSMLCSLSIIALLTKIEVDAAWALAAKRHEPVSVQ